MNNVNRGLRELRLCEKLECKLDLTRPDYELIRHIKEDAALLYIPTSEKFTARILGRIKRRRCSLT